MLFVQISYNFYIQSENETNLGKRQDACVSDLPNTDIAKPHGLGTESGDVFRILRGHRNSGTLKRQGSPKFLFYQNADHILLYCTILTA